jgi:hypothetical protein
MEDPEVPLEAAQEHIQKHAEEHGGERSWVLGVALSSAIFAALAAVASLQAGHHVNEALISQLQASDAWAYYQAKGIKAGVLASKMELLEALGKPVSANDRKQAEKYKDQQDELQKKALELEGERAAHLQHHVTLATSVTMFQVSIAVAAISVLTGRRLFWWVSLVFGAIGIGFVLTGLLVH